MNSNQKKIDFLIEFGKTFIVTRIWEIKYYKYNIKLDELHWLLHTTEII